MKVWMNGKIIEREETAEEAAAREATAAQTPEPTAEDRLAVLESAVLELGGMIGND